MEPAYFSNDQTLMELDAANEKRDGALTDNAVPRCDQV